MIFLTVGTQLPFDRLVRAVDEWAGAHPGQPVVAQVGRTGCRPRNMQWSATLSPAEFEVMLRAAEVVVAHAGMGTALAARHHGKRLLVLPRVAALGEQRNDHQLATARELSRAGLATVADDAGDLVSRLDGWRLLPLATCPERGSLGRLVGSLRTFIAGPVAGGLR